MSKDLQAFFGGSSPVNQENLAAALAAKAGEARSELGGTDIIKLSKTGIWRYGQDNVEVEEGALWAINPLSIKTGFIAWKDAKPLQEEMRGLTELPVYVNDLPQDLGEHTRGPDKGKKVVWTQQIQFSMQCMSGEDEGVTVVYKTNSVGGRRAGSELIEEIAKRAQSKADYKSIVPVVELQVDDYPHSDYGQIFVPIFAVQKWVTMDGLPVAQAPVEEEVVEEEKPKRGRPAAKKAEEVEEAPEVEEVEEDDAPASRRRTGGVAGGSRRRR